MKPGQRVILDELCTVKTRNVVYVLTLIWKLYFTNSFDSRGLKIKQKWGYNILHGMEDVVHGRVLSVNNNNLIIINNDFYQLVSIIWVLSTSSKP